MEFLNRYPHELSGGQLQRVVIARAALLEPDLIVCDEATSALDVSIQNQVANMLVDLQGQEQLSYIFIGHDLALVRQVSHRIIIMYRGEIVEILRSRTLTGEAAHPYTKVLLEAVFEIYEDREKRRKILEKNANESGIRYRAASSHRAAAMQQKTAGKKGRSFVRSGSHISRPATGWKRFMIPFFLRNLKA